MWPGESTGAGKVAGGEGIGPGDTSVARVWVLGATSGKDSALPGWAS